MDFDLLEQALTEQLEQVHFVVCTSSSLLPYLCLLYGSLQIAVWSPDGRYFALPNGKHVYLYPVGAERPVYILPSSGYTANPVFSPKSKYLAIPMDGKTTLWDVQTGRLLKEISGENQTKEG